MMEFENITILIPVYMPSGELTEFVETLLEKGFPRIAVVDDGSGKEYSAVFDALPSEIRMLRRDLNNGKGRALKTGLAHVHKNHPDCIGIITCYADGRTGPTIFARSPRPCMNKRRCQDSSWEAGRSKGTYPRAALSVTG